MPEERRLSHSVDIGIEDIGNDFLTLRIGEEIPRLEIRRIRKITNPSKEDNFPGVNYKYIIESTNERLLLVNTWSLWKKIAAALREAGTIQTTLELKHLGVDDYQVRSI